MFVRALLLILLLLVQFFWVGVGAEQGAASAQTEQSTASQGLDTDDYEYWEQVANRAEEALSDARASNSAFEVLRSDLAAWRARFKAETQRNSSRIASVEAQVSVLGEPPEGEDTESEEVASRRAELDALYWDLVTPVRTAEVAHARANSLITEVDHLIRDRLQAQMLMREDSPLSPETIRKTIDDLRTIERVIAAETSSSVALALERGQFGDSLVVLLILAALAALLLIGGRKWIQDMASWILRNGIGRGKSQVLVMLVSFGQVIVPGIGLILLTTALLIAGFFGAKGEQLIELIPGMGLAFFGARWLGGQTFPKDEESIAALNLTARQRVRGRFYFWSLGILMALAVLVSNLQQMFILHDGTKIVLAFPIVVAGAFCLWGLGGLLIANGINLSAASSDGGSATTADERSFFDRVLSVVGRVCKVCAVIGPIAGVIGFARLSIYLTLAPSLSLGLMALLAFLLRLNMALFRVFGVRGRDGTDSLWAVLVNFLLTVLTIPLFDLIWGGRRAELEELWRRLSEGVVIGSTRISPSGILAFMAVFLFGYLMTRLFQGVLRTSILPRTKLDPGAQSAVTAGMGYVGLFVAGMFAVSVAGLDLGNLAIVAGALSVGLGFGLQNIVSNFVSGLILLAERPVSEGDWIEVGEVMGTVRKISVRATTVETFDRTEVVVPNSDLVTQQVTNWTRTNLSGRLILPVGVAYGSDTRKVQQILQEIAEAHPLVIVNPPPLIVFQGFGADSLDFEMRVILRDINFGLGARTELNHNIAERFAEEGIEIPFAQRDIWLRNPETLRSLSSPAGPSSSVPDFETGADPTTEEPT